jgi:F-type H+-transporting ATPase subunit b
MPQVNKALDGRENTIAAGLRAAEEGKACLEQAKKDAADTRAEAKKEASVISKMAKSQAEADKHEAKEEALLERKRLLALAQEEIEQQKQLLKKELQNESSELIIAAVNKFLGEKVDASFNQKVLQELLIEAKE